MDSRAAPHHSRDHHAVTKSRNELTRRIQSHTASTGLTAQPRPVLPSFSPRPSLEGQGAGQGPLIPTHWPLPTARTFLLKTKGILSRFPSYQQGDPGVWCLSGAPAISLLLRRGRGPQQPHFQGPIVQMIKTSCPQPGGDWKKPKSPQVPGGQRKHTCRQSPRQLQAGKPHQNKAGLTRPAKGVLGRRGPEGRRASW